MRARNAERAAAVRNGTRIRFQVATRLPRLGVSQMSTVWEDRLTRLAKSMSMGNTAPRCSTSTGTRTNAEGLLSREDDSNPSSNSVYRIPEGLLSREDDGLVARSSSVATRFVPEGVLSRKESSTGDSEIGSPVHRDVPEGLLSREELSGTERESDQRQFNWFQQWYPVAALDAFDPTRPHAFTLLGQDLVLWRDGSGRWRAFKDACPHRLAPLSEGRIEKDGTLLCAYHAWRFDGSGACTAMPFCSADDPGVRSPRSCAVSYPTLERGGLLWVWAQGGQGAEEAAAAKQPPVPPEVQGDGRPHPGVACMGWSHRDLPYGHTYFVENVVDFAHVPVSHHNIAGNRYKDPRPFQLDVTRTPSLEEGFKIHLPNMEAQTIREAFTDFIPPGLVRTQAENRDGSRTILALFSTPIRPGWTRVVGQQIMVASPDKAAGGLSVVGFVGSKLLPVWLAHVLAPLFLHQDMVFLHYQERAVTRRQQEQKLKQLQPQHQHQGAVAAAAVAAASDGEGTDPSLPLPQYFTPGTADMGVAAWRTWLAKFAGGDVTYAPGTPPLLSSPEMARSELFEVWNTHTRHCTICLNALKRLQLVRVVAVAVGLAAAGLAFGGVVAKAAAAAAAAAVPAVAASSSSTSCGVVPVLLHAGGWLVGSWEGLGLLAVAAVAAGVVLIANKVEQMMHKYEYSHADNH